MVCSGKKHDGTSCTVPVVDGKDHCIFHLPDKNEKEVAQFGSELDDYVRDQAYQHNQIDLTGFHIPHDINLALTSVSLLCDDAVFYGKLSLQNKDRRTDLEKSSFRNAEFRGIADFRRVRFSGDVSFDDVTFRSKAIFSKCSFDFPSSFNKTQFLDEALFSGADFGEMEFKDTVFSEGAMFDKTIFEEAAVFTNSNFDSDASFLNAVFRASISFSNLEWKSSLDFQNTEFQSTAIFHKQTFNGLTLFGNSHFSQSVSFDSSNFLGESNFDRTRFDSTIDFTNLTMGDNFHCENASIVDTCFVDVLAWKNPERSYPIYSMRFKDPLFNERGVIDFKGVLGVRTREFSAGVSIITPDFDKIIFTDEKWMTDNGKSRGRKQIIDHIQLHNPPNVDEEDRPYRHKTPTSDQVAHQYRRLRVNYEKMRRHKEAGDFFIGEMEVMRHFKPIQAQTPHEGRFNVERAKRSKLDLTYWVYAVYFEIGRYGENYLRPLGWMFIFSFLVTSLLTFFNGLNSAPDLPRLYLNTFVDVVANQIPLSQPEGVFELFLRVFGSVWIGALLIGLRREFERK